MDPNKLGSRDALPVFALGVGWIPVLKDGRKRIAATLALGQQLNLLELILLAYWAQCADKQATWAVQQLCTRNSSRRV